MRGPEGRAQRAERRGDREARAWTPIPPNEPTRRGFRDGTREGDAWTVGLDPDPRDDKARPTPRLHRAHRAPKGTDTRAADLREASALAERELRDLGW